MKLPRYLVRTAAVAVTALFLGPAALAVPLGTSYSFALDVAQAKAGLPGANYGTVTLTQGQDVVDVKVALADGFVFANTGVGAQFAFNLTQDFANADVTLDAVTAAHFVLGSASSYNVTPYGVFTDALLFKGGTKGGTSAGLGTPLQFSVARTGISLDAFATSGARNGGQAGGYSFAVDIGYAPTGKTGGVGAIDYETDTPQPPPPPPAKLPEPMSVALLGFGLCGVALARRRRRK
jgi:hypothetical protein